MQYRPALVTALRSPLAGGSAARHADVELLPFAKGFSVEPRTDDRPGDVGARPSRAVLATHEAIVAACQALERRERRRFGDPDDPLVVDVSLAGDPPHGVQRTVVRCAGMTATLAGLLASTPAGDGGFAALARLERDLAAHPGLARLRPTRDVVGGSARGESLEQVVAIIRALHDQALGETDAGVRPARILVRTGVLPAAGGDDGRGVAFSRDPLSGAAVSRGAYRRFGRGEIPDVLPLERWADDQPELARQLDDALASIEVSAGHACRVGFRVIDGTLTIEQARPFVPSARAAVRIAVGMVDEGLLDVDRALATVPLAAMLELEAPVVARPAGDDLLLQGRGVRAGSVTGPLRLDLDAAGPDPSAVLVLGADADLPALLGGVRATGPVVAVRGDVGAVEAMLARPSRAPSLVGAAGVRIDGDRLRLADGRVVPEGALVTLDGGSGRLLRGDARRVRPQPDPAVARLLAWCDDRRAARILDPDADATEVARPGIPVVSSDAGAEAIAEAASDGRALLLLDPRNELPATVAGRPWAGIVAPPGTRWAAALLATRI